ncbi:MAG: MFS transporter [Clostridiales bacterium]|nr:MFS transporter [Clostridiales bacterium]
MHKKLWNKDYILLLQGNTVSAIGDLMYSVAIGYWVYQQTGSSALMGIMSSISMFVTMFFSPVCGSIVDKCNRKWLIVGIDVMQGVLMLAVGLLAYFNSLSVPVVLLAALAAAFGSVFYSPAVSTLMLDIIPRDDMVRGQSVFSGVSSLINLAGSALSGVMVAFLGVPLIVVINGLSNLYSAASELFIRVPRTLQQGTQVTAGGLLRDMGSAMKTIFADGCLRLFVPCALLLNLLGAGPLTLALPFCMEKGFNVDAYGYFMAVYMVGSLLSVLVLGIVKLPPKARFWVMALGFTSSVLFFTLTYFSVDFLPMCVFLFLSALTNAAGNAVFNAALMLALPQENRSAILGFINSAACGGTALSAVIYGFLGDVFPLYLVFAAGSILSLLPMIYMCFHKQTKAFILSHCE